MVYFRSRWRRIPFFLLTSLFVFALGTTAPTAGRAAEIDFVHDIAPILSAHCGKCHTGDKKQGGYSMNSRGSLLAGGESGVAVKAGQSGASELIARLTSDDKDQRMPPEGPRVPADKIAILKRWIDQGAPWQDGFTFKKATFDPPLRLARPALPPAVDRREHPIDRMLDEYLARRNAPRPPVLDDAAFARRVSLDIVGLLPAPERLDQFLSDRDPAKRLKLIEELLANETGYAEHWLSFWNDLLRNDYTGTGFITGGRKQITGWLYRSLVENKPYDQFVRELIAPTAESEGFIQGIRWRGNVSASQTNEVQFAQSICQSFLGINMKCASCHDSFIDRWKLDEAYGLAAIYATQPLEIHRCDKPTGRKAEPYWIFPELGQVDPKAPQPERLKQLAALMTHPDNGRFSRTIVNRIWHRLMGRGIVHPTDAMHTEPWYPELLDLLAMDLVEHQFDLKRTIGWICTSQAYQSRAMPVTSVPDDAAYVYAGPVAKRMSAEQFVDAVWQITGAAPPKVDAPIQRGKPVKKNPGETPSAASPSTARWIWSNAKGKTSSPAGEAITVRRRFDLKKMPTTAAAAVTCDNSYVLYCNGQKLAEDGDWNSVESVSLRAALREGVNELLIVGINGGGGPNPAGIICQVELRDGDAVLPGIGTDDQWEWTDVRPDGQGRLPTDAKWQKAVVLMPPLPWDAAVRPETLAAQVQMAGQGGPMVRASLVKLDALMRSLGRPNRDQIVTMRPSELTTLEALDLANAQSLADALSVGAAKWQREADSQQRSSEQLVDVLYRAAVGRAPTADERREALALLGEKPAAAAIEDLLWSVFMLPEFQLVR